MRLIENSCTWNIFNSLRESESIPSMRDENFNEAVLRDFRLFLMDKYGDELYKDVTDDDVNEYFTGMFYDIWDNDDLESANAAEDIIRAEYHLSDKSDYYDDYEYDDGDTNWAAEEEADALERMERRYGSMDESEDSERILARLVKDLPDTVEYKGKTYQAFNVMSNDITGATSKVYYCNMENTPSGDPQESNDYFFVVATLKKTDRGYKGVDHINYVEDLTEGVKHITESASDRYQVREFDGPGAKFGIYDTKQKKFIQKGSKKVMIAGCDELNKKASNKHKVRESVEEHDLSKDLFGDAAANRMSQKEKKLKRDLQYVRDIMSGKTVIDDKYHEELSLDTAKAWLRDDFIYVNELSSYSSDEVNKRLADAYPDIFSVNESARLNETARYATNIDWETDGDDEVKKELPKKVEIPQDVTEDTVADWLSDKYGWLVNSVSITEKANDTVDKKPNYVIFYLNGKELGGHDLKNEFEGERESAKELFAYENGVKPEDIEERLEYRENMNESVKSKKSTKKQPKENKRVIMQQGNVTCFKENDNTYYVFENENDNEVEHDSEESAMHDFLERVGIDANAELK